MIRICLLLVALCGIVLSTNSGRCNHFQSYCSKSGANCPDSSSNSLNLNGVQESLSNFDAVSFQDLVITQGDVQGRVAVKNDFIASSLGVSVGDQIDSSAGDVSLTYSLVVGHDARWVDGELFPDGSGASPQENAFVGGNFSGAANLAARVTGHCASSGCLDANFNSVQSYWISFSALLASNLANVQTASAFGTLTITCSSSQQVYYVNIDGSDFSSVTGYQTSGCNANAIFVFNIVGSGSVLFDGTPLNNAGGAIYNIIGSGRAIVSQTFISGSVINPQGSFNQTGGTLFGALIAGNCPHVIQINRPQCPPSTSTSTSTSTTGAQSVTSGSVHITSGAQPVTSGAAHITSGAQPVTSGSVHVTSGAQQVTSGLHAVTSGATVQTTGSQAAVTSGVLVQTTGHVVNASSTSSQIPITTGSASITSGALPSTTGCVCPPSSSTSGSASSSTTGSPSTSTTGSTTGSTPVPPPVSPVCPLNALEDQCSGLTFTLEGNSFTFGDFHVISFGSITASTGDIEGRVAALGDASFGNGFAIGTQVSGSDNVTFSLIAGSVSWGSGSLQPENAGIFSAGSFTGPAYLEDLRTGGPCNNSCLTPIFNSASSCYNGLQSDLSNLSDNVNYQTKFSTFEITCQSSSASQYVMTVNPSSLDATTVFNLVSCNSNAAWIININGTGDVDFHGASFPAAPENVIYNIEGEGRSISVNTAVNGAILAPGNFLNVSRGVVIGKVVVGSAFILQVNKPACPVATTAISEDVGNAALNSAPSSAPSLLFAIFAIFVGVSLQ